MSAVENSAAVVLTCEKRSVTFSPRISSAENFASLSAGTIGLAVSSMIVGSTCRISFLMMFVGSSITASEVIEEGDTTTSATVIEGATTLATVIEGDTYSVAAG